jgi:DNA-binding NarL/FixJ family response regulator
MCQIVIADDHAMFREGVKRIRAGRSDFKLAGEAADGLELLKVLRLGLTPDVVILDISMPRVGGIEVISEIKSAYAKSRVLVLTMHRDEDQLCEAFVAGADGYLLKEDVATELFSAIDAIVDGKFYVSPLLQNELTSNWVHTYKDRKGAPPSDPLSVREKQVLKLIAEGKVSKEIADTLSISVRTVDHHRANISHKLNVKSPVELLKYAIKKHLV